MGLVIQIRCDRCQTVSEVPPHPWLRGVTSAGLAARLEGTELYVCPGCLEEWRLWTRVGPTPALDGMS